MKIPVVNPLFLCMLSLWFLPYHTLVAQLRLPKQVVAADAYMPLTGGMQLHYSVAGSPYASDSTGRILVDTAIGAVLPLEEIPAFWYRRFHRFLTPHESDSTLNKSNCSGFWNIYIDGQAATDTSAFDYPAGFSNGYAVVSRGGLYGLSNSYGALELPCLYNQISHLGLRYYACRTGKQWQIWQAGSGEWTSRIYTSAGNLTGPWLFYTDSFNRISFEDTLGNFMYDAITVCNRMKTSLAFQVPLIDSESETEQAGLEAGGTALLKQIHHMPHRFLAENKTIENLIRLYIQESETERQAYLRPAGKVYYHRLLEDRNTCDLFGQNETEHYSASFSSELDITYAFEKGLTLRVNVCQNNDSALLGDRRDGSVCSYHFFNYAFSADSLKPLQLKDIFTKGYENTLRQLLLKN